jgi:hypothetical protein
MLLDGNRRLAVAVGVICLSQSLFASGLRLRAVEGNGMVVSANAASARKIVVVAEDDAGQALKGVTVRFRLPSDGPSGRFASGLSSESIQTSTDGRATVIGVVWNNQAGRLLLGVSATLQGDIAELEIPVEISGRRSEKEPALTNPGRPPSSGIRRKWLILAATVAGAAALGIAASSLKSSSTPAAPAPQTPITPVSVPPVVSIPVIGIGVPVN